MIRMATPEDATAILSIYGPFIEETSLTFETEVPTINAFAERIRNNLQTHPWLVWVEDDIPVGYAYACRHRERTGYQWCAEASIYLDSRYKGKGIGRSLYLKLFEILKIQGYRNIYAVINLPNEPSVLFHESCGFKWFASYENVGYKLGKWKTVGWWQLKLNEYDDEPAPPIPLPKLDWEQLHQIVTR